MLINLMWVSLEQVEPPAVVDLLPWEGSLDWLCPATQVVEWESGSRLVGRSVLRSLGGKGEEEDGERGLIGDRGRHRATNREGCASLMLLWSFLWSLLCAFVVAFVYFCGRFCGRFCVPLSCLCAFVVLLWSLPLKRYSATTRRMGSSVVCW